MAVNQITIEGNLGSDPELKAVKDETLSSFSLAHTPRKKINNNWEDGETVWFRVTFWNSKSDQVLDHLKKGDKVIVIGTLSQSNYTNKAGEQKSSLEISGTSFSIIPRFENKARLRLVEDAPAW